MPYESYEGINARCRYYVRVTVARSGYATSNMVKEVEFVVRNVEQVSDNSVKPQLVLHKSLLSSSPSLLCSFCVVQPPAADSSVKLEVGIEDCLHIEFEYDRTRYHLSDVVTGRVNFLLVRIAIKYMEVALIRREAAGPGE
jgi:vacuolar protein sorting-associated protein 26